MPRGRRRYHLTHIFRLTHPFDPSLPKVLAVDAFLCLHAIAMCELYMPFNRSLIAVASTRYAPSTTPLQRCPALSRFTSHICAHQSVLAIDRINFDVVRDVSRTPHVVLIPGWTQVRDRPSRRGGVDAVVRQLAPHRRRPVQRRRRQQQVGWIRVI